jgi:multiple sugar transport system substrate-binding protein
MISLNLGRRRLIGALLISAVALPMLGASGAAAQDQPLRVFADGDGSNHQAMFDAFTAATGIEVVFEGVPFPDYQNTIVQRFRTGNSGIDVFMVDPTYVPTFAERGFLYDLTEAFGSRTDGVLFPADVQGATYKGRMLTMPLWESTQLMYYNRTLLEKAGIPFPSVLPEDRMTWEQVVELAKKAQAAGAESGIGFEQVDRYYQLQVLPESLNGGPGVTGDDLLTPDVANDAWIKAGQFYGGLYADGIAPAGATNGQEMRDLFTANRLAFFISGPWNIARMSGAEGLDYAIAPHPYFEGGKPATSSESWHLGIASDAPNVEAAKKFLEFISLTTEGALSATKTGNLSANIEAAAISLAAIPAANPNLDGVDKLISYELANSSVARPRTLGYLQLEELVSRAWGDIRNGGGAATVFTGLQSELERSFSRIGR